MSKTSPLHREIFKNGSKTYFNSSLFFPPEVRNDVFVLYGFVRTADDFVDSVPQDVDGFAGFVERYRRAREGAHVEDPVVDAFIDLSRRRGFEDAWANAFLESMEMDVTKQTYETIDETLHYIYGSAEVIGLFMARILGLPSEADRAAMMLGRAMQYINFIRDVDEDRNLGRTYLPLHETELPDFSPESVRQSSGGVPDLYPRSNPSLRHVAARSRSGIPVHSQTLPHPDQDRLRDVQLDGTGYCGRSLRRISAKGEALAITDPSRGHEEHRSAGSRGDHAWLRH